MVDIGVGFQEEAAGSSGLLDMTRVKIDPAWAVKVPADLAQRLQVLPFAELKGKVYFACIDPRDSMSIRALEPHINRPLQAVAAGPQSLRRMIQRIYSYAQVARDAQDPLSMVTETLHAAHIRQASDIHFDPERESVRIRFRVDGQLEDYRKLPSKVYAEYLSRLKILAGLDISEKRVPQDGRFSQHFGPEEAMEIRVATIPTKYGERASLRLILPGGVLSLENLGMSSKDLGYVTEAIGAPNGLILATGPTGSGKSTTLYSAIRRIKGLRLVMVLAVQDPIEFDIPGTAQVEVDVAANLTFARALRSILRQDPDVIMFGSGYGGHCHPGGVERPPGSGYTAFRHGSERGDAAAGHGGGSIPCRGDPSARDRAVDCEKALFAMQKGLRPLRGAGAGPQAAADGGDAVLRAGGGRVLRSPLVRRSDRTLRDVSEGPRSGKGDLAGHRRSGSPGDDAPAMVDDAIEKTAEGLTSFEEVLGAVAT